MSAHSFTPYAEVEQENKRTSLTKRKGTCNKCQPITTTAGQSTPKKKQERNQTDRTHFCCAIVMALGSIAIATAQSMNYIM